MSEVRIDLAQYLSVVRRWWRTAIALVIIVVLFTGLFTLLADDVFITEATLLPQAEAGQGASTSGLLAGQLGLGSLMPGMATPADIVISMLRSRTLAGWVVDKIGLQEAWGIEGEGQRGHARTVVTLQKATTILMNENGLIKIRVADGDPQRVAAIVNAYLDELDRANVEFSTSTAAKTREFVEKRLDETRANLGEAAAMLQSFQEEHGAMDIEEQTRTTVEVIASLQGDLERLRAQRDMLSGFRSGSSSEIGSLDGQISALEARISYLTSGDAESGESGSTGVLLELGDVPALTAEYARLLLAVQTQGEIYAMLSKEFELARIEETRNTPTIRVLDRAEPPLYRTSPRPKLYLVLGFIMGCGLAFVAILLLDRFAPQEAGEGERWRGLIRRNPALGRT